MIRTSLLDQLAAWNTRPDGGSMLVPFGDPGRPARPRRCGSPDERGTDQVQFPDHLVPLRDVAVPLAVRRAYQPGTGQPRAQRLMNLNHRNLPEPHTNLHTPRRGGIRQRT